MHIASRLISFVLQPSHVALLLIGIGVVLVFRPGTARLGKVLAAVGFGLMLMLGFSPLGHALLLPLEERFPRGPMPADGIAGIIILGGFEDGSVSHARGALALNESAERLAEAVVLARSLPEAKVVFTGGVADILRRGRGRGGAAAVSMHLQAAGIAPQRIVLEGRARNTYENAVLTRELVTPAPGERWLLVTSAWHMPRAVGAFRHAGFDVIPWPVDYRTTGADDLLQPFDSLTEGLRRVDAATREWIGLLAYWLLGRSSALLPEPRQA
ncbi:MAG: YdcF family protein [Hyphomicrobiaceae bacterium]|nr:YdcF family protein [Hyphomicrobiaceae bacterium]